MRISDWSSDVCSSDLAVGADDMPAGIRLVARHDFAQAPRGCHYPIDQPFARAVAKTIADDDSRAVPGLPERDRRHRMEIDQDRMTKAAPRLDQSLGERGVIGSVEGFEPPVSRRTVDRPLPQWRSDERRVGQECVSTCRSRWSPYH